MNTYEVEEAYERWHEHPLLGPATATLMSLRDCADQNSDGWAYWHAPSRAAGKLVELIAGDGSFESRFGDRSDITAAQLRAAYSPIKAFRTRTGLKFDIFDPAPPVAGERQI